MKQIFSILIGAALLLSCGNREQSKAINEQKQALSELKKLQPGDIPTTENGWTMTAKLNGKDWRAISMVRPDKAGQITGDDGNGRIIWLPYRTDRMVAGKKITVGDKNIVELFLPEEEGSVLNGEKGEMEITKADDNWAEGKFYFTGSSDRTNKVVEVTDGFFRISLARP